MKTAADLKINDVVWKDNYNGDPYEYNVTELSAKTLVIDHDRIEYKPEDTVVQTNNGYYKYYLNHQDALLAQYRALKKEALKAQKNVVKAMAEVDDLLRKKDDLVFRINDAAECVIKWDEVNSLDKLNMIFDENKH